MRDTEATKEMIRAVARGLRQDILAQREEKVTMDLNRLAAAAIMAMVKYAKGHPMEGLH